MACTSLSPWDRHERSWDDDHEAYDRFYLRQLEELCTRYGELVEVWFDGACSEHNPYDWCSIMANLARNQPTAMIFNMGSPTICWVGNEDSLASDPCWYTVDSTHRSIFDNGKDALMASARYLPPECEVAIRWHWFWHQDDLDTLKTRQHLDGIWYLSVGLGANLLLNVPPDRRGQIDEHDLVRLAEFRQSLRDRFARPIEGSLTRIEALPGLQTQPPFLAGTR
ncbi:MAG: alpha-L-fucosidase [Chloroflexota bacterium]|nr:alpha-L-fucosidase [Chloroflexota bacterium]